jgi:hypothetical protein
LAFDLVHVPGEPRVTGHLDGVVTLDLTEADDERREGLRRQFGERSRTLLGHLRHEVAHQLWRALVLDSGGVEEFRSLFGDERSDYARAIEAHHGPGGPAWDPQRHITAYASSHPHEDWAETVANHLAIVDAVETADVHLLAAGGSVAPDGTRDFAATLARWRALAPALDDIAETLGTEPTQLHPPFGIVTDKLAFVDRRIQLVSGAGPS